ncbi:RPM1-interacting protein 4-like [Iris pallida]|uniref:RPM1-interacting protein 4-like n=1 Tax=Iris pallida TaxID=29817 RepID=A0AAX6EBP1_IRIPA|nr:RPM1-interacting protein 4-like [Iris pallida]
MANHARVPKFGNWESGDDVPYTQYFDNARKGKTAGKLINPNDPQENPVSFSQDMPVQPATFRTYELEAAGPKNDDVHRYRDRDYPSDPNRRARKSGGSDSSFDQSPLHPAYQAKGRSRVGANSPSLEKKGASEGAPNTPGRARGKNGGRGGEIPGRGPEVPKFGEWDESDPASADDFSHIFNKVREERQVVSVGVPSEPKQSSSPKSQKRDTYNESKVSLPF